MIERKTTILNRPWHQLAEAVNQKYPNPHSKSAKSNDVITRYVDGQNRLCTEKWVGNNFPIPSIIRSTFVHCTGIDFPSTAFNYQMDVIDAEQGVYRQYSKNNTMSSFLNCVEVIQYKKLDSSRTEMTQTFHVGCTINSWVDSWFEGQFVSTCLGNSTKGLAGLEWVADKLNTGAAGLIDLERFREGLKELKDDCEQIINNISVDKIQETTGEISRAVNELYEKEKVHLQEISDEVKKITLETTDEIVETASHLANDIEELKSESVKNFSEENGAKSESRDVEKGHSRRLSDFCRYGFCVMYSFNP